MITPNASDVHREEADERAETGTAAQGLDAG